MNMVVGTASGPGAMKAAQFVVVGAVPASLPQGRQLTGTASRIVVTDGGAGLPVTLSPGALIVQTDQVNVFTVGPQTVQTGAIGNVGLIVQLAAGVPTADALQIKDNGGNVLSGADERGILFSNGIGAADDNLFIGQLAGNPAATGASNVALAFAAGSALTSGRDNVFIGRSSGGAMQNGTQNVAIGTSALASSVDGANNFALGRFALNASVSDNDNVAIGTTAMAAANGSTQVVAIGTSAYVALTTGHSNVGIGYQADAQNGTGQKNVMLGHRAGFGTGAHNKSGCVYIGYQAGYTDHNSNRLYIANTNTATPLIYGEFDNHIFRNYASTAVTAAVQVGVHRLAHVTSGVAAPLFGISATHELEDGGGVLQTASEDATLWAVATAGSEQPLRRWTNYPNGAAGPGYGGYITADDVDNVALTIIPNGAGDVTVGLEVVYFVSESAGGTAGGNVTVLNGAAANLYADGVDTLALAVAADGSVTLQRTAGAATFDVSLWLVWV